VEELVTTRRDESVTIQGAPAGPSEPSVLWLYGVIPEGQAPPALGAIALETVHHHSLCALVESVPREAFTPEVLEQRLQSLEGIEGIARRHQAVLSAAMAIGTVIPARLCSLFSGADAVVEALASGEARFSAALERVAGCWEWGLKLSCDERRLRALLEATHPDLLARPVGATPGLSFLLEKKREARALELTAERIDEVADLVLDVISPAAEEIQVKPLPTNSTPGDLLALRLAALVERGGEEAFRAAISDAADEFGPEGFSFQVSGPWAPFSFCDEETEP
jgi:hypothetical protein